MSQSIQLCLHAKALKAISSIAILKTDIRQFFRNKAWKLTRWFILSAGAILLVTGLAKIVSGSGRAPVLALSDPIVGISFHHLILWTGILELIIAGVCLLNRHCALQVILIAWLATVFLIYRLALMFIGWRTPCHCLGYLTDAIRMDPQRADMIMKAVLGYLLLGSYTLLCFLHKLPVTFSNKYNSCSIMKAENYEK